MLKASHPDQSETLPGSTNVVGRTSADFEQALRSLTDCGMKIEGKAPVEVYVDPGKSVKNQLISLVSQGRMFGVNIVRDADRFDPARMTQNLISLGFNRNQAHRFMRNIYQTPAR